MPLFVTCTSKPSLTTLQSNDYPIAFDTTNKKIYFCRSGTTTLNEFNCKTILAGDSIVVSDYDTEYGIYHSNSDGSTLTYVPKSVSINNTGHITSMNNTSTKLYNIVKTTSIPTTNNTTLYMVVPS